MPTTPIPTHDRHTALHSPWITRLHLDPPPRLPPLVAPRFITDNNPDCLINEPKCQPNHIGGFGPFKVKIGQEQIQEEKTVTDLPPSRRTGLGKGRNEITDLPPFRGSESERFSGVKLSPFFQMRPVSIEGRREEGRMDESRCGNLPMWVPRSERVVDGFPFRSLYDQQVGASNVNPLPRSRDFGYTLASKAYFDAAESSLGPARIHDPQARHWNLASNQFKRPIQVNGPEEPFSFWNMGRDKRRDNICSVLPSVAFTWNQSRKRNADAINIRPWKSGKIAEAE